MLLLGSHITCSGQELWTLERCIEYGLRNNPDIERGRLDIEINDNLLLLSKTEVLPSLFLHITHSPHSEKCISPYFNSSLTLFGGLGKYFKIKASEISSKISRHQLDAIRIDLILSIIQSYLEALMAQEMIKISKNNLCSIEEQYLKSKVWFDNGKTTHSTLLELDAQRSAERVNLIIAQNRLALEKIELAHLINCTPCQGMILDSSLCHKPLRMVSVEDADSIFQSAVKLPSVEICRERVELSKYITRGAQSALSPTISLDATYDIRNNIGSYGITLNIPIFNHYQHIINVRNTKLEWQKEEISLQQELKELYREVFSTIQNVVSSHQAYIAASDYLEHTTEIFYQMQNKFDMGITGVTDYNISKNNMIKAQIEKIKAKYQYILECEILEIYEGKKGQW